MFGFKIGFKRWRVPVIVLIVLIVLEFPLTVATLALFGIADPDTYRTKLWGDGADNGFNSDPSAPLYAAANHLSLNVPLVWSDFITKYNLVISVLSTFILLTKSALVPLHVLFPPLSLAIHGLEVGLYAYSLKGQVSPDTIDPQHPNFGPPWYITKSCSVAALKSNIGYCQQAKASFYVTVFMVTLFSIHVILAIHSMLFAPQPGTKDVESEKYIEKKGKEPAAEQQWEMVPVPETPGLGVVRGPLSPTTPRTRAFNALDGGASGLPFREHFPPPPTKATKKSRFL